jgi:hypothetical protein
MTEGEEGRNWKRGGDYMIEMYSHEGAKKKLIFEFFSPLPTSWTKLSPPPQLTFSTHFLLVDFIFIYSCLFLCLCCS